MNVRLSHLLLVYLILPAAVAVTLVDQFLLDRAISLAFPFRPESWLIWVYLFGMPHVVGGMQIFADSEYLQKYGWRLARILAACFALPLLLGYFFGARAVFILFIVAIMYHTVAQQFGLTLVALKRAPDVYFYVWKWSAIGLSVIIYTMMYWSPRPIVFMDASVRSPLILMASILMALVAVSACLLMWKNRGNKFGVLFVFANMALMATEFYLFSERYYFLVVVVGRVVHEFTAWPIYMVHDSNRNAKEFSNWIYRGFRRVLPTGVLTLVVAFGLGIALTFSASLIPVLAPALVSLSLYHYYTEHFLWRKESLLRQHVKFVP